MPVTDKSLYELTIKEIEKRLKFNISDQYKEQSSKTQVTGIADLSNPNASLNNVLDEVISSLREVLRFSLPNKILDGLWVSASADGQSIVIETGTALSGGAIWELDETTVTLDFPSLKSEVLYVNIFKGAIKLDTTTSFDTLTVAKIVIPDPGGTNKVINKRDTNNPLDAYIINMHEYSLYGDKNGYLEEESIELLRDNIKEVIADNLLGNIRLSENLKILNTQGTLELNSDSIKMYNKSGDKLCELLHDSLRFYDSTGGELAKFAATEARIGNILLTPNTLQSRNFLSGSRGFQIQSGGNAEFNDITVRGTIYASTGEIGGWTIDTDSLYATTTGTIKTGALVAEGYNGVILDKDGLRGYNEVLGEVFNLPTDGSAPTFSSGVINETIFEISTNSVIRTSEYVGIESEESGRSYEAGILINNTGIYACAQGQPLSAANIKILNTGDAYFSGTIYASSGTIGSCYITSDGLGGGVLTGTTIKGSTFEAYDLAGSGVPKVVINENGIEYQISTSSALYGESGVLYGEGTTYGSGVTARLFNPNYPILSVESETGLADIRLYNRNADPGSGTGPHEIGDLICVDGNLKICTTAGGPGVFSTVGTTTLFLQILESYSTGTHGGTFSSGIWTPRNLNNIIINEITESSLDSGPSIYLPAGTYYFEWFAIAYRVVTHKTILYNLDTSSAILIGSTEKCNSTDLTTSKSIGSGKVVLSANTNLQLLHACTNTGTTTGFGAAMNAGFDEVYAGINIWKFE